MSTTSQTNIEDNSFREGDVVFLRSGGTPMTINKIEYGITNLAPIQVVWFDADGQFHEAWLFPTSIKKTPPFYT